MMEASPVPVKAPLPRPDLGLARYRPLPGVPDELTDAEGRIHPLWRTLIETLQGLSPEELARARTRADQYLRDSGVFYRMYGSGQSVERPWPLSPLPVLIHQSDWDQLSAALIQRADLLEALMADLYGANTLIRDGHLPPHLLASNPEWLRPMVGVAPQSGHYLHIVAFEIGRGPDGRWWVLADRTQAPSGAGYALENRVAISRAYPKLYSGLNVARVSGFFRALREQLIGMGRAQDGRVAILSPGPLNETYYEQAWLARHLGIALVQGEDLTVSEGQLMLRTVSGLRPLDVLWRRLDGNFADPLELDPASRIGTPGMVSALRQGKLSLINALGSGVLETRALMAFLPRIAPILTGRPLAMPNIATWWCGAAQARAEVQMLAERMMLSPALGSGLPSDHPGTGELASTMTVEALATRLEAEGDFLVAQEAVTLSTTPTLVDGQLTPRPMSLRVFLTRTAQGWQVMPGGLARIGAESDPTALAMQQGGATADVWILNDTPLPPEPPSAAPATIDRRAEPGSLPARSADNLFWLGRYVERTEGNIRLLRARHIRLAESGSAASPLIAGVDQLLAARGLDPAEPIPQALRDTLSWATGSAGQVRDRFSPDGWAALNDLDKTARRMAERVTEGDDAAGALSALLRKLAGFSGLVHENMYQFLGWRFLSLGRQQERAMGMADLLSALAGPEAAPGAHDLCIEVGDCVLTHRRRFVGVANRASVIELLALDPLNPRSIRHQLDGMAAQIAALPEVADLGQLSPLGRAMLRLQTLLATETPESLDSAMLSTLEARIAALSDLLTETYFR